MVPLFPDRLRREQDVGIKGRGTMKILEIFHVPATFALSDAVLVKPRPHAA